MNNNSINTSTNDTHVDTGTNDNHFPSNNYLILPSYTAGETHVTDIDDANTSERKLCIYNKHSAKYDGTCFVSIPPKIICTRTTNDIIAGLSILIAEIILANSQIFLVNLNMPAQQQREFIKLLRDIDTTDKYFSTTPTAKTMYKTNTIRMYNKQLLESFYILFKILYACLTRGNKHPDMFTTTELDCDYNNNSQLRTFVSYTNMAQEIKMVFNKQWLHTTNSTPMYKKLLSAILAPVDEEQNVSVTKLRKDALTFCSSTLKLMYDALDKPMMCKEYQCVTENLSPVPKYAVLLCPNGKNNVWLSPQDTIHLGRFANKLHSKKERGVPFVTIARSSRSANSIMINAMLLPKEKLVSPIAQLQGVFTRNVIDETTNAYLSMSPLKIFKQVIALATMRAGNIACPLHPQLDQCIRHYFNMLDDDGRRVKGLQGRVILKGALAAMGLQYSVMCVLLEHMKCTSAIPDAYKQNEFKPEFKRLIDPVLVRPMHQLPHELFIGDSAMLFNRYAWVILYMCHAMFKCRDYSLSIEGSVPSNHHKFIEQSTREDYSPPVLEYLLSKTNVVEILQTLEDRDAQQMIIVDKE